MPLADALATGCPARDVTLIVERPDGSRVSVLSTANPVRDGDGRTIGAIECFQEVSGLRDMMVELTDRQLNLEAALKENDQRLSSPYEHVDIGIGRRRVRMWQVESRAGRRWPRSPRRRTSPPRRRGASVARHAPIQ